MKLHIFLWDKILVNVVTNSSQLIWSILPKSIFKHEELNFIIRNGYSEKSTEDVPNFPPDEEELNPEHYCNFDPDEVDDQDADNKKQKLYYLSNLDV